MLTRGGQYCCLTIDNKGIDRRVYCTYSGIYGPRSVSSECCPPLLVSEEQSWHMTTELQDSGVETGDSGVETGDITYVYVVSKQALVFPTECFALRLQFV